MKKKYVMIILLVVFIGIILFMFLKRGSLNNKFIEVEKRTYFIYFNKDKYDEEAVIKKLKKYKHVEGVGSYSSYRIDGSLKKDNFYFNVNLMGTIDNPVKITKGKNFVMSKDENMIICQRYIYQNSDLGFDKNNYIDLDNKVGKNINLYFEGDLVSFKLVGLYEADGNINRCYTKFSNVSQLNTKYYPDIYKKSYGTKAPFIVVLDDDANYSKFLDDIKGEFSSGGSIIFN